MDDDATRDQTLEVMATLYEMREQARKNGDYRALRSYIEERRNEGIHYSHGFQIVTSLMMGEARKVAGPEWDETIEGAVDVVIEADRAYEAALGTDGEQAARKAYEQAKKAYRVVERQAFAYGWSEVCGRCGGTGRWPGNGGVCFNCGGSGRHPGQAPRKFEAAPPVRAKRTAAQMAKLAAQDIAYEQALSTLPARVADALRNAVAEYDRLGGFYNDSGEELGREDCFRVELAGKLRRYGSLTAGQVAAVERGLDKEAQRAAEQEALADAPPLEDGKREVEGVILSTKVKEGPYGSTLKMLLKLNDGNKLWGTVPKALEEMTYYRGGQAPAVKDLVGCRVAFSATVERSADDPHFGFYSRPTKPRLVQAPQEVTA